MAPTGACRSEPLLFRCRPVATAPPATTVGDIWLLCPESTGAGERRGRNQRAAHQASPRSSRDWASPFVRLPTRGRRVWPFGAGPAVVGRSRRTISSPTTRKSMVAGVDIGWWRGYGFSRNQEGPQGPAEMNCRAVVPAVAVRRTVRWRSFEARVVSGRQRDWPPDRVTRSDERSPSAISQWQYP